MSNPPPEREESDRRESEPRDEEIDLSDTERNDEHEEDDQEELRRLREQKHPKLPPLRSATMRQQDVIKRRTGGTVEVNVKNSDRERDNLNTLARIRGDGNVREDNFKSLRHAPKKTRMFKELLVTGKFKEMNNEGDIRVEEEEIFALDEEDILEYNLFNSMDNWSRRTTSFLNL